MKISVIEFIYNVFSCDQASLWIVQSVCWLVGLSHILSLCFHHRSIMKISGVNTIDRSDVHANGQGQRSKVKVTEVKTQFSRFRTITPVYTCGDEMMHKAWCGIGKVRSIFFQGHPSNFKITRDKKSPILSWIGHFWTVTSVWIHWWLWNDAQSLT